MVRVKPYKPLYIKGSETGLVQNRQEFILPDDAFPVLENAYLFREQIKRRQGLAFLGRLRRTFVASSLGNSGASPWSFNIYSTLVPAITPEANAEIELGSVVITIAAGPNIVFTDQGDGTLTSPTPGNSGTINYLTGAVVLTHTAGAGIATTITFNYFPCLPVMGLRTKENDAINNEQLIAFDTKYAYRYSGGFQEFIAGTTWNGTDTDFFWTTSFWQTNTNIKLFWATNFNQSSGGGDPIRYTDGSSWTPFSPKLDNKAPDPTLLTQCLAILPFRGRLVVFNTWEGTQLSTSLNKYNRIRWAQIGDPTAVDAWRDDIRGKGGYLDIPTSEAITSVGFVRDNLVIYCERSTWQLRYTGRSISPFQIEKVNSELGADSTFSAVQFDTSLMGIGDKGVVECDSFKSERIDIKIPDLVYQFRNVNNGTKRVYGIRDIQQRLAYWTYPLSPGSNFSVTYPNRRLVYNYENDSWAIFTDSLTCFGTIQLTASRTWAESTFAWETADFPWVDTPALFPSIIGGNQQGFVMLMSNNLNPKVNNDETLTISGITGNTTTPTVIEIINHNLQAFQVIEITGIPSTSPFAATLNGNKFGVYPVDANNLELWVYDSQTGQFSIPQTDPPGAYIGGGVVAVRDGFSIVSKKFNFLDDGENIQMGYFDILTATTDEGEFSVYVYLDYNDDAPINVLPQNVTQLQPDTFFNSVIPTSQQTGLVGSKTWKRVFCPVRGAFITLEFTLSNAQLISQAQSSEVQIDSIILWIRRAGKQLPVGV